jgi:hypothetical protein
MATWAAEASMCLSLTTLAGEGGREGGGEREGEKVR